MDTVTVKILISGFIALVPQSGGQVDVALVADSNHQPELRWDCRAGSPLKETSECRVRSLEGKWSLTVGSLPDGPATATQVSGTSYLHNMKELGAPTMKKKYLDQPGANSKLVAVITLPPGGTIQPHEKTCSRYDYVRFLGSRPERWLSEFVVYTVQVPKEAEVSLRAHSAGEDEDCARGDDINIAEKSGGMVVAAIVNRPTLVHSKTELGPGKKIKHFKRIFEVANKGPAWTPRLCHKNSGNCRGDCLTASAGPATGLAHPGLVQAFGECEATNPASGTIKCPVAWFEGSEQ